MHFCLLLISLIYSSLLVDGGNCVQYKVGMTLNSNEYVEGYIFISGHDAPEFHFDTVTIKQHILKSYRNSKGKLLLYKDLHEILYPTLEGFRNDCEFHFYAAAEEDMLLINLQDIHEVVLLEILTCNNCDRNDINAGFRSTGIYPEVITELTKKEIQLLKTKPVATHSFSIYEEGLFVSLVISYNASVDAGEIKNICNEYANKVRSNENQKGFSIQQVYAEFKESLRKKNVVIFSIDFLA